MSRFSVFKGALEVAFGLDADGVDEARRAAVASHARGDVRVVRSDGSVMVRDDRGQLVSEGEWRAQFSARYGARQYA